MFTGIVEAIGEVVSRTQSGDGVRLIIDAIPLDLADVAIGDSVSVSGCCLTVVSIEATRLGFDVSGETLRCTTGFDLNRRVNLEKSLRLSDRLGGHLVSGHVDGIGTVVSSASAGRDADGSVTLSVDLSYSLARYVAAKGSIAVDGVSLTTNDATKGGFTVNLIPHTLAVTTLGELAPGSRVNVEVDQVARYVGRFLDAQLIAQGATDGPDDTRAPADVDRRPSAFADNDALRRSDEPGDRRSHPARAVRKRP